MTKICKKCQIEKSIDKFAWKWQRKKIREPYCIDCKKILTKEYDESRNTEERRQYKRDKVKISQKIARNNYVHNVYPFLIDLFLKNPCPCGETNPLLLEFDHINPYTKLMNISMMLVQKKPIEKIKKEIKKCRIICRNCHMSKTAIDGAFRILPFLPRNYLEDIMNRAKVVEMVQEVKHMEVLDGIQIIVGQKQGKSHRYEAPEGHSWCAKCKQFLLLECFNKDNGGLLGVSTYCKSCRILIRK